MRRFARNLIIAVCGLSPLAVRAEALPSSFTLGQYVPGDWWMFVHLVRDNPERKWLEQEWAEVWDALAKSGIDKDVLNLITGLLSDEQRSKTESTVTKVRELLNGVSWGDLIGRELVFAERIAPPQPHYAILMRGTEGSGEKNAAGLADILRYIASFSDKLQVIQEKKEGVDLWILRIGGEYNPHLFRKGDLIGLVTSAATYDETIALVNGTASKPPIIKSPRFLEAMKQIKAPEDAILFFDTKLFFRDLDDYMEFGFARGGKADGDRVGLKIAKAALNLCDFLDYGIVSAETEDRRTVTHTVNKVQAEKVDSPLAKICRQRKAFDRFDKYIPADATGFSVDTFFDLGLLYHTVLDFVEKYVPDGAGTVNEIKLKLAEFGFDPDRDLFSWWSGEMISIEMPAAVVTPMGGGDAVLMVRVKDSQLAAQKVGAAINWSKTMLDTGFEQTLLVSANPGGLDGFTEVTHPMIAMFVRPVIGVRDEWLMIGSSAAAVSKCLDVASGKSPSISKNERFQKEGLIPKGAVTAVSFTDTSNFAQELGQGLGMASMMGGMMAANIPADANDPDAKKGKELVQRVFSILMKLSPVVAKMDFYSSQSTMSVEDGLFSRSQSVVTYKAAGGTSKTANSSKKP